MQPNDHRLLRQLLLYVGSAECNTHGNQFAGVQFFRVRFAVEVLTFHARLPTHCQPGSISLVVLMGNIVQYLLVRHSNNHSLNHLGSLRKFKPSTTYTSLLLGVRVRG